MVRLLRPLAEVFRGAFDELCPDLIAQAADASGPWRPDEPEAYCARCGASAGPGAVTRAGCAFCTDEPVAWDRITRLGAYAPPLDEHIRSMKFRGQWRWTWWMGDQLAAVLAEPFDATRLVVCPVPMHWRRRWRRGFNQAELIAGQVARRRGWLSAPLLRRTRWTRPQTAVAASGRAANVQRSVALAEAVDLSGWEVLLVDDVKTSGATLHLCARVLRRAGARSVHVAVAAVADPRGGDFTRV